MLGTSDTASRSTSSGPWSIVADELHGFDPENYAAGIHDNGLVLLSVLDGKPCPWCERGVPESYLAAMEADL